MSLDAEIIAIGDEMVSGQRLDTNTQWLSQQLGDLGIEPRFHTTVSDSHADGVAAFSIAASRADIVISTGGIGPTKDDLTRQVLAETAGVELEHQPAVLNKIREIFSRAGREMPENNQLQAWFPAGSQIINNREGTAPGIDLTIDSERGSCRFFALPGVPYEMHEMYASHVRPAIQQLIGNQSVIQHYVVHCFGAGESQIETMLGELTARGRTPRVGITASQATISLRITATGGDAESCQQQIGTIVTDVRQRLGELVFGENSTLLEQVVCQQLLDLQQTVAIADFGFGGTVAQLIFDNDESGAVLLGAVALPSTQLLLRRVPDDRASTAVAIEAAASEVRARYQATIGLAIAPPKNSAQGKPRPYMIAVADAEDCRNYELSYGGHSGLRSARTAKQILNQLRLHLMEKAAS